MMRENKTSVVPRNGDVFVVTKGAGRPGNSPAVDPRANPPQSPFFKGGRNAVSGNSPRHPKRGSGDPAESSAANQSLSALAAAARKGSQNAASRHGAPVSHDPALIDRARRLALEPTIARGFNDLFHADAIESLYGSDIRYCRKLGGFLVWDGARWREDDWGQLWRYALFAASSVYFGADAAEPARRLRLRKWATRAERRTNIENALRQLRSRPKITAEVSEFDRDPWLFSVKNGTIDLSTGDLRVHRREDMITRLAPVEFDPACGPPRLWMRFLSEIFDGNAGLMDFVRRVCGYALCGSVGEQKLFFLHGEGANGKTTFLETLMHVMGDYACRFAAGTLFSYSRAARPATLGELRGRRLAVTGELESGRRLAEAHVKEITGGDRLPGGHTRRTRFDFEPTHTLFVCGNHLPVIRGRDHAMWRRIDLIPFAVTIPEGRQDKGLREKLRAEAPGILNWLMAGCLEWQHMGLAEPAEVTEATCEYRSNMDVLRDFLNERCVIAPDAEVSSAELNRVYGQWCKRNGERRMSATALGLILKERGFAPIRTNGARMWGGIDLRNA